MKTVVIMLCPLIVTCCAQMSKSHHSERRAREAYASSARGYTGHAKPHPTSHPRVRCALTPCSLQWSLQHGFSCLVVILVKGYIHTLALWETVLNLSTPIKPAKGRFYGYRLKCVYSMLRMLFGPYAYGVPGFFAVILWCLPIIQQAERWLYWTHDCVWFFPY